MRKTPVTASGLRTYDKHPALEAVILAWTREGPNPGHHKQMKNQVRYKMPLLARALDRLVKEVKPDPPSEEYDPAGNYWSNWSNGF